MRRQLLVAALALLTVGLGCGGKAVVDPSLGAAGGAGGGAGGQPPGGSGGGGAGPVDPCEFPPPGLYGAEVGQVLGPSLSWDGYLEHSQSPAKVSIEDYFDCDGTKGMHALLFVTDLTVGGSGQLEPFHLKTLMVAWEPLGIRTAILLLDGADVEDAKAYVAAHELEQVAVFVDPDHSLVVAGGVGVPQYTTVDPRTLEVVARAEGNAETFQTLELLAASNGGG